MPKYNSFKVLCIVTSLGQPAFHNKEDWLTWLLNVHQLCKNLETWKMKCSFVIWIFQLGWLTKVKMWWRIVKLASLKISSLDSRSEQINVKGWVVQTVFLSLCTIFIQTLMDQSCACWHFVLQSTNSNRTKKPVQGQQKHLPSHKTCWLSSGEFLQGLLQLDLQEK